MKSNRSLLLVVALVLAFSSTSFAQPPAEKSSPPPPVSTSSSSTAELVSSVFPKEDAADRYRIGPGDVLDIRILNRPNLSRETVRVEGNGMIRMPLIEHEIQAGCKTEGELAKDISARYAKFYRNLQVDVFIKEYRGTQVAIIGLVNEQGRFQLQRRIRLLELLTYAKGPSNRAGQSINIVHSPPLLSCPQVGAETVAANTGFSTYRLSDTLAGKLEANPYLQAGDIVTLPEADQIYVVGNVHMPLTIPLKEPIRLSEAIAMAGGVGKDTKKDKIRILRQEPGSQSRKEIMVDLAAIEKKQAEDVALMPNDIINVQASEVKSLLRSLVTGGAQSLTQLPVRVVP